MTAEDETEELPPPNPLEPYMGRWIVLFDGNISATYPTFREAHTYASGRWGEKGGFMLARVGATTPVWVP